MAVSVPVSIASDQSNVSVVVATALPAGTNNTVSTSASGNTSIVAAVAGKDLRVIWSSLFVSGQVDIYWNDGTDDVFGDSARKIKLDNSGSVGAVGFILGTNQYGWFETGAVNRPLQINLSAAVAITGAIGYVEI